MARSNTVAATVATLTGAQKAAATRAANKAAREAEAQAAAQAEVAKQEQLAQARAEVRASRKAARDAEAAAQAAAAVQAQLAADAQAAADARVKLREQIARDADAMRDAQARAAQHAKTVQPEPAAAPLEDMLADFTLPSWKRVAVGIVLGLAGAVVVGYGIGMLMAYALAGIATLTASAGIAFVLSVLVWVIGIYSSWKIGGWVGGKIFGSVVLPEGLAARSAASVSNAASDVKGWFSNRPVVAATREHAQAFTGAWKAGKPA